MNEPTSGPSSVSSADAKSFDAKPFDANSFDAKSGLVQFAPPDITRRRAAAWNGIRADIVDVVRREAFDYRIRTPHHVLIMCERAEREDGESRIEGLPRSTLRKFNRKLSLVPAGHEFHGWQKPRVLTRVTYFYIDPRTSLADPDLRFAEQQLRPRLFFFDSDLWETAAKLKAQAENAKSGHQGYAQALGLVLIHEILRLNEELPPQSAVARGGLAGWQKHKVSEYIEEHLADDISLTTLAALVRLSTFHFARAFKRSFALPPHRYLTSRRVERAKDLLALPQLSVTEVGMKIGFSDTSSFSAAFRKHTGMTPTDYRRSRE